MTKMTKKEIDEYGTIKLEKTIERAKERKLSTAELNEVIVYLYELTKK